MCNLDYGEIEFVLLDWNSSDDLTDFVSHELADFVDAGIVKYYKTTEPEYFDMSRSKNVAGRLATGEILCWLDADNFLGAGFAEWVNGAFAENENIYIRRLDSGNYQTAGEDEPPSFVIDGLGGRICVKKSDFLRVRGYDEALDGWGAEDSDFGQRLHEECELQLLPLAREFNDPAFSIDHSNQDRTKHYAESLQPTAYSKRNFAKIRGRAQPSDVNLAGWGQVSLSPTADS